LKFAALLLVGTLWDIGVWYYCRDLQIYDEEEGEKKKSKGSINPVEERKVSDEALAAGNDLDEIRLKSVPARGCRV